MGDYVGFYDHTGDKEVTYFDEEDVEDWSWMYSTRTEDAEEEYSDEVYTNGNGINYEIKYSDNGYSSQRVARISGRFAPAGTHKDENESLSSKSSKEGEVKVKPKLKKEVARGQFEHLQERPLDAHSDPGYGGSYETAHSEHARSQSINLVTSWLRDASLGEHSKDSEANQAQHGRSPPKRRPPPRRHPPGADMAAHSHRRAPSFPGPDHQHDSEAQYCDKTPAWDPSEYKDGCYENPQFVVFGAPVDQPAPESLYRPESKPLDKALKVMRTAAVGLKSKSIEFKNMAVPVLTPILKAVYEESKEHLMGPEQSRGRATPTSLVERDPGRGQAPMARPMRPGMAPVMRPAMRPGPMPAGQRPRMLPPGGQQSIARRPLLLPPGGGALAMVAPAARGRGVAMRGQPRLMGGPQAQARPISLRPAPAPIDF